MSCRVAAPPDLRIGVCPPRNHRKRVLRASFLLPLLTKIAAENKIPRHTNAFGKRRRQSWVMLLPLGRITIPDRPMQDVNPPNVDISPLHLEQALYAKFLMPFSAVPASTANAAHFASLRTGSPAFTLPFAFTSTAAKSSLFVTTTAMASGCPAALMAPRSKEINRSPL